jgi:hypothetical protein
MDVSLSHVAQMHFILPEYLMQRETGKVSMEEAVDALAGAGVSRDDGMAALERQMASSASEGMKSLGFVSAGVQAQGDGGAGLERGRANANDEEIGLEDDEEEEEGAGVDVAEKSVPDSVFGNLAKVRNEEEKNSKREPAEAETLGAKERFKRQKNQ